MVPCPVHHFGPFRYDPDQRLLFREGELIPLAPKAIDTLHALLERRGQVIDKSELMKLIWPDCVVEEIGLARNISLLRKALGDDGEAYIETVPKRGYRFAAEEATAPVAALPDHPAAARRRNIGAALILLALLGLIYWQFYRPSRYVRSLGGTANLAVVPIESLSIDLEQGAFPRGFTEALTSELSRLRSVQIISPSTVERYRQFRVPTAIMARLLGLHVVIEGTAQSFGRQVRVSLRLTDVHSGRLIWAEGYDVSAEDPGAQTRAARDAALRIGQYLR